MNKGIFFVLQQRGEKFSRILPKIYNTDAGIISMPGKHILLLLGTIKEWKSRNPVKADYKWYCQRQCRSSGNTTKYKSTLIHNPKLLNHNLNLAAFSGKAWCIRACPVICYLGSMVHIMSVTSVSINNVRTALFYCDFQLSTRCEQPCVKS